MVAGVRRLTRHSPSLSLTVVMGSGPERWEMDMLPALAFAAAVIVPQAASTPHWDLEDRRAVSSVISPCLTHMATGGNTQAKWSRDWPPFNPPRVGPPRVRARSDGSQYQASMYIPYERRAYLRCSVTVPNGDLAGALLQLDALAVADFTMRREGNERRFYDTYGSKTEPEFTLGAQTTEDGGVMVWIASPSM